MVLLKDGNLNFFQNYLTNRKQYVEFDDTKSDMLDITTGVPLGLFVDHYCSLFT